MARTDVEWCDEINERISDVYDQIRASDAYVQGLPDEKLLLVVRQWSERRQELLRTIESLKKLRLIYESRHKEAENQQREIANKKAAHRRAILNAIQRRRERVKDPFVKQESASLPLPIVVCEGEAPDAMHVLVDEIDRRAVSVLSWAYSGFRRHSRRYDGYSR